MNRRQLLKQVAIISGGIVLMPACADKEVNAQQVLAEVTEKILPGANETGAPEFILRMVNDCFPREKQDLFFKGLRKYAAEKPDIAALNSKNPDKDDLSDFYGTVKSLTIQCYTNSKPYMTNVRVYELVPGRYHGCVPVTETVKKTF
jgi:hypothetical protein